MESCKPQGLATGRGRGMESGRSGRPTLMASTLVATFFLYASDCRHIKSLITRYMDSYVYALTSSRTETLLQAAHAVKPAL